MSEETLGRLERLVDEIESLNCKLVLVIGRSDAGKTELLAELAKRRQTSSLSVGAALGKALLSVPASRRHLQAPDLLREMTGNSAANGLILLDDIEVLFDRTLRLNPLDLLRRNAQTRRVVASWPGELQNNRLSYAAMGHPEHQDYDAEGIVAFRM
ncbi:hypothetical protein UNPA324_09180 [Bradyrhizobium sp. UNPA324]|nr:hypothetical protein UNPA324_09180 [Bradyrhizobium sp. UNPA324]